MVDVLGIISGIITITQFFEGLSPDRQHYKHRIRVGQADDTSDGWMPQSIFYDVYGNEIAKSPWQGTWVDVGRWHEEEFGDDSLQVGQIEVHNGNNAVCFVWHEWYDNDGSDPIILLGETAQWCGAPWYYSDISVHLGNEEPQKYRNCAWIDQCNNGGPNCRDNAWGGYGMYDALYWRNIKNGFGDANDVCNQLTRFEVTWKRDLDHSANATAPIGQSYIDRVAHDLIYTERKIAAEACQSASSRGQSLVSTAQGLFCDMTEHVLYPICQPGMTDACFDVETDDLRVQHADSLQSRDVGAMHFNPSTVKLDADQSGHVAKRSRAADTLVGNGRTHFYTAGVNADESDCLTADQIDGDNYTGPVTDSPAPFARISNGIIVNPAADDSQVIVNCPADYSPKKRYIRGRPVA